jgi:RNA polymerase sigma-70 factor (ECF subfamily)
VIDATKLAETWDACVDRLLLIARSIGGPAEDAVQEAFIALARQQQLPDDPMAWLVRVTRNKLLEWQRSGERRRRREAVASQQNWFDNEAIRIDQRIDADEVTAALIAMPSPEREVIVMHLWGGLTFEAISQVLEMSRASAHRSYHQGLSTLQRQFNGDAKFNSMRICHE